MADPIDIHEAINRMTRSARGLAPRVTESALDSACTDTRPIIVGRAQRAWDLVNMSFRLNAISDRTGLRIVRMSYPEWVAVAEKMPVY